MVLDLSISKVLICKQSSDIMVEEYNGTGTFVYTYGFSKVMDVQEKRTFKQELR